MISDHPTPASAADILEAIVATVSGESGWDAVLGGIASATHAREVGIDLAEGDHIAWGVRHRAQRSADAPRHTGTLVVSAALGANRELRLTLTAAQPAGPARRLATALLPSLCAAALAARRESGNFDAPHAHASAVAKQVGLPYVAADSHLRVVHASADARALLDCHPLLRIESGRLYSSEVRVARLRQLIVTALREQRSVADCLVSQDRRQFLAVRACPFLTDAQQWHSTTPLALLLLNPERGVPKAALLRARIGLSNAEAELLACLVRGQSISEIAAVHQRSPETLRSQLKAIFVKTATHTQSEVVALAHFASLLPAA